MATAPVDITGDFTTWTSGNSAVATVATKQVHAVGAGSTNAYVYGEVEAGNGGYCTLVPAQAVAPVTVCPSYATVSALTPLSIVLLFPQLKTGIGAVAAMQYAPKLTIVRGFRYHRIRSPISSLKPRLTVHT